MKQLVYGGILMITGMLGVIAAILALSASIADNASIMFLILHRRTNMLLIAEKDHNRK